MELPGNVSFSFLFEFARQLKPNITHEEVQQLAAIAAINTQQQQQQQDVSSKAVAAPPAGQHHVLQQGSTTAHISSTPPPLLPPSLQLPVAAPAAAAAGGGACSAVTAAHPHISAGTPLKLSLEIGHSCLSSGCGDSSCSMCQHNPSRRCKADLKQKYVTRDYIRSNCGAGLLVRLVDDSGQHYTHQLPGWKLQVCVLDAKRYKEINPTNMQLGFDSLAPCILDKPLLRWENGSETAVVTLPVEGGQVHLPELQCFSITGEHRAGKACDYRLAFWIEHQPILPRVSEPFTVVCLRSRAAIKSEVPLSDEPVGRLEGIGEQAVATLKTLGQQLGPELGLPADLASVEKVGQFCDLVKVMQANSQLEKQLLPLFKKADWKKATQHAACTVFPDFRPRVWWCPRHQGESGRVGLLFRCENAVVQIQRPFAWVQRSQTAAGPLGGIGAAVPDEVCVFAHPGQQEQQAIQLAAQDWDSPQHGSWSIYWLDPVDPLAQQSLNPSSPIAQTLGLSSNPQHLPYGVLAAAGITSPSAAAAGVQSTSSAVLAAAVAAAAAAAGSTGNGAAGAAAAGGHVPSRWLATPQQELQTQQQLADLHLAQHLANMQQKQQQQQPSPFYSSQTNADGNRATITTGADLPPPPSLQQQDPLQWGSNVASAMSEAMAILPPPPPLQQPPPLPWGSTTATAMSGAMAVAKWLSGTAAAAPAPSTDPLAAAAALATLAAAAGAGAATSSAAAASSGQDGGSSGSSLPLPGSQSVTAIVEQEQRQQRSPAVSMFTPPAGLMEQMPASLRGEEMLTDRALREQHSDPLSVSMAWIPDHLADDFPESLVPGLVQMRSVSSNGGRDQIAAAAAVGPGARSKPGNTAGLQHRLQESYSLPSELLNSVIWKSAMAPDVTPGSHVLRDIMALADSFRQQAQQEQQQHQHDHDHDGDVNMTSAGIGDVPSLKELQRAVLENLTAAAAHQNAGQMPVSLLQSDSLLGSEQERLLQECNQALLLKQLTDQLQQQKQQRHFQQQQQQQQQFTGWHR